MNNFSSLLASVLATKLVDVENSGPEWGLAGGNQWLSKTSSLAAAFPACASTLANCFLFRWTHLLGVGFCFHDRPARAVTNWRTEAPDASVRNCHRKLLTVEAASCLCRQQF